jgi:hypothetical protein
MDRSCGVRESLERRVVVVYTDRIDTGHSGEYSAFTKMAFLCWA